MKAIIASIFIFSLLSCVNDKAGVSPDNGIDSKIAILTDAQRIHPSGLEIWIPKMNEIERLIPPMKSFVESSTADSFGNSLGDKKRLIILHFDEYFIQCYGYMASGRKKIYFNFFTQKIDNWKNAFVLISDGGYTAWHVEYDIESKRFINLTVNGEA
jgi:hypothetical protein